MSDDQSRQPRAARQPDGSDAGRGSTIPYQPPETAAAPRWNRIPSLDLPPGTMVGPYKVLSLLGEGGFGVVYLAERTEPHDQRVALKIIKPGMDSKAVIARFEQERQALAVMDHPNVAKVFDAGATLQGRPFFVMQYVKGEPITAYCDRHNLTIRQRLELFIPVCEAVQHAHMKGIIHRDIKPSNVLVSIVDDRPMPTVIDFGVAKAIAHTLTEKTIFTEQGLLIGTPEYMSPEQAEMGALDVDTRTDVYSLGVLLYELLTGAVPFDREFLQSKAFDEIRRIIREVDPPRPSTKLSASGDNAAAIAHQRQTRIDALARQLRSELEWIPMMAMRKDRAQRYKTAVELADDIRSYLAGRPLLAGPESVSYRFRKFVRRNRGPVAAAMAVLVALLSGLATTLWQAREAKEQAESARERADQLTQVSDFQANMLAQVDPTEAGRRLTADVTGRFAEALAKAGVPETERGRQAEEFAAQWRRVNATDAATELIDATILKPAVAAIDKQFRDQPLVDAQLRQVLADRYVDLGLYDAAMPLQASALSTRRRVLGDSNPATLTSINSLGVLFNDLGRFAEAESFYREALEKRRRVLGEEHPATLISMSCVGMVLTDEGKFAEAEAFCREVLEKRRRVLGEDHPETLQSISNLSVLLRLQGRLAEVEPYYREVLEKRRRVLGEEHRRTLHAINNLGVLLGSQGKLAEAEAYYREALEKQRRVLGEEHPDTFQSICNIGVVLRDQGKLAEAEPYMREALEKRRRVLGEEHPDTLTSISNMGGLLQFQGKLAEAEAYYREALEKQRRVLGEEHRDTLQTINHIGVLLKDQGKLAEAEPYFREALEKRRRVLGEEHPDTIQSINNIAVLLKSQRKFAEAEAYYREALQKQRRVLGEEHPATLGLISNLGSLLIVQRRYAEAETTLLPAAAIAEVKLPTRHRGRTALTMAIARLYATWDKAEPGKGYDIKAAEWRGKLNALTDQAGPASGSPPDD